MSGHDLLIVIWIITSYASSSFWEAYIEGKHGGAKKQVGPEFKMFGYTIRAYHIWLWFITFPLLLTLPLVINFSTRTLGLILMGYFIGSVAQDFLWFVVNPKWPFKNFRPDKVDWYPWLRIGKFALPFFYIPYLVFAWLAWVFLIK